jgi:microcystin-dependent protein
MAISPVYPVILQNGTLADANQVMADFFQIQNDVNNNAAHNGANSDITSLLGLTTPLPISEGGTGASTAAQALINLGVTAALAALITVPLGSVIMHAASTAPTHFLECNGQAISRTTYATLFGVIGTTFGSGDGATTFNIPDMRGYFPRGWDDGAGVDPARVFGSTQTGQIQAHTHGVTDPMHTHTFSTTMSTNINNNQLALGEGGGHGPIDITTTAINAAATGISIQSAGGSETRPVNVALMFIIRVS